MDTAGFKNSRDAQVENGCPREETLKRGKARENPRSAARGSCLQFPAPHVTRTGVARSPRHSAMHGGFGVKRACTRSNILSALISKVSGNGLSP